MFRTEVVKSKNIKKTLFYKIFNFTAVVIMLFVFSLIFKVWGESSSINEYINKNYEGVIKPVVLVLALLVFVTSIITNSLAKSAKRLGSIEIDEKEIRYLVNDEVQEKIDLNTIESIKFEFYSFKMRGNPQGSMNYFTINQPANSKTYELVLENTIIKAKLGETLALINKQIPVKITYAYWLKRIFKDRDFQFK